MKRNIIEIDQELCNGCGICVDACHEGALVMENGKAKLITDSYCDGLGDCLPQCPTGAIRIIQRDANAYDEVTVKQRMADRKPGGCPGSMAKTIPFAQTPAAKLQPNSAEASPSTPAAISSELRSWPVQIQLVPVNAPYFDGAHLLIAADCAAYAYANIHSEFMRGKITLIGCPKLDAVDYTQKLTEILTQNNIKSVTVLRMEVPCCGGLLSAAKQALQNCGKMLPWNYHIISTEGALLED